MDEILAYYNGKLGCSPASAENVGSRSHREALSKRRNAVDGDARSTWPPPMAHRKQELFHSLGN
jgi:hypothetical protein